MTASQIEAVVSIGSATIDYWNNFLSDLLALVGPNAEKFELSATVPNTNPATTIEELGQKLGGATALLHEFSEIESTLLIPDAILVDLLGRASTVRATVERLLSQVNS